MALIVTFTLSGRLYNEKMNRIEENFSEKRQQYTKSTLLGMSNNFLNVPGGVLL